MKSATFLRDDIDLYSDWRLEERQQALLATVAHRPTSIQEGFPSAKGATVATALARGADEFLTKPVDFPKLKQDIIAVMTDATGATDDRATNRRDN